MQRSRKSGSASCPSAQPGMAGAQVIGVVTDSGRGPEIGYLSGHLAATEEILEAIAPLPPTQVLRLAARCEESQCRHFDGTHCRLATRIVESLPEVVSSLPPCAIRKTCRWYGQEGRAACLRCPQVLTYVAEPDERTAEIAAPEDPAGD